MSQTIEVELGSGVAEAVRAHQDCVSRLRDQLREPMRELHEGLSRFMESVRPGLLEATRALQAFSESPMGVGMADALARLNQVPHYTVPVNPLVHQVAELSGRVEALVEALEPRREAVPEREPVWFKLPE